MSAFVYNLIEVEKPRRRSHSESQNYLASTRNSANFRRMSLKNLAIHREGKSRSKASLLASPTRHEINRNNQVFRGTIARTRRTESPFDLT